MIDWLDFTIEIQHPPLILFPISIYFLYSFFSDASKEKKPIPINSKINPAFVAENIQSNHRQNKQVLDPYLQFKPRIKNVPESAPVYDSLRTAVVSFPKPNCLMSQNKCECYTQQGTFMRNYPRSLCKKYVLDGRFDPTKSDFIASKKNNYSDDKNQIKQHDNQGIAELKWSD